MRRTIVLLAVLGASLVAAVAAAQDKPSKGTITLKEIQIIGRVQKPIAAVEVSRIQPSLLLNELRQPFLDRIENAILKEPF